ncbi:hypothetical protein BJV40_002729 [Clostridium beijerinckii]|nr:hypothetical protein [Clostridium beijerinckii]
MKIYLRRITEIITRNNLCYKHIRTVIGIWQMYILKSFDIRARKKQNKRNVEKVIFLDNKGTLFVHLINEK